MTNGASDIDILADDPVLPAQFWSPSWHPKGEPEKRLMIAVLEDALGLLLSEGRSRATPKQTAVREAKRWMSRNDRSGPFSFASICDLLGLEVRSVRAAVARLCERRDAYGRKRIQAGAGRHRVTPPRRRRRAA